MKRLYRGGCIVLTMLLMIFPLSVSGETVYAPESNFVSYTYDYWGNTVECPSPYTLVKRVTGMELQGVDFKNPNDMFSTKDGTLYLVTSGTKAEENQVLKLDSNMNLINTWRGYTNSTGETVPFKEPLGIFVTENHEVYIADAGTKEILHLDDQFRLIRIIRAPSPKDSNLIKDKFVDKYRPSKLVVDTSGRIHVVAVNINQGIVEFDTDGKFDGFLAAGKVYASAVEVFWRNLSTEAQIQAMNALVPIEYSNITLDNEGFLFASLATIDPLVVLGEISARHGTEQGALVRRLNMMGTDILRRKGFVPPVGDTDIVDAQYSANGEYSNISKIADITSSKNGCYTILDTTRSHIFTYDSEGFLLYAFSGPDVTAGGIKTPTSMTEYEDYLYVLDSGTRSVVMYKKTRFAKSIEKAISYQESGEYGKSAECWQQVLDEDANYDLAYTGLGKEAYSNEQYKRAMELFKLSNNREWYSKSYKELRNVTTRTVVVPVAVTFVMVIIPVIIVLSILKRRKKKE